MKLKTICGCVKRKLFLYSYVIFTHDDPLLWKVLPDNWTYAAFSAEQKYSIVTHGKQSLSIATTNHYRAADGGQPAVIRVRKNVYSFHFME